MKPALLLFLIYAGTDALRADDPAASSVSAAPSPAITFQVLSEVRIPQGDHFVIFQGVAPPVVSQTTPAAAAQPQSQATPHKVPGFLSISATVYDHVVTELRWTSHGKSLHAFSNLDFNVVAVLGSIETADRNYSVYISYGNETAADLARENERAASLGMPVKTLPTADQFPQNHSGFLMIAADSDPTYDAADLAGMKILHLCYDSNEDAIQQAYQARRAAQAAREQASQSVPPTPKDTIIRYWPIKSKTYLGTGGNP